MKRGNTRIHINVISGNTAGEQTSFGIKDISALRRQNGCIGFLRIHNLHPFVTLKPLNANNMHQHSGETCCDEQEHNSKAVYGILAIVGHTEIRI